MSKLSVDKIPSVSRTSSAFPHRTNSERGRMALFGRPAQCPSRRQTLKSVHNCCPRRRLDVQPLSEHSRNYALLSSMSKLKLNNDSEVYCCDSVFKRL
jgi:hypothetical protein